ncbi:hypothetical protein AALP_AAs63248U000100, partial [Arabis alpina]
MVNRALVALPNAQGEFVDRNGNRYNNLGDPIDEAGNIIEVEDPVAVARAEFDHQRDEWERHHAELERLAQANRGAQE